MQSEQYSDEFWMVKALALAEQAAAQGEVPVGALIVKGDELISATYNLPISNHDATAHAEILAMREAGQKLGNYRLSDCTLYVTLEPCTMCFGAMVHARIGRLVYGAKEAKAGVIESQLQLPQKTCYNHVFEISGGVLADECGAVLSRFFAKRRDEKKALKRASKTDSAN